MSLHNVVFPNHEVKYIIYQTQFQYTRSESKHAIGLKIIEEEKKKTANIQGINASQSRTLGYLSDNNIIKESDVIYD